jgi:hypothetical protein
MKDEAVIQKLVAARAAGMRKLDRLTAGVAVSAFAGVGLLGALGAFTIPGTSSSHGLATCVPSTTTSTTTESDETNSDDDSTSPSSTGLAPSCVVNSSTGAGVAVSGGSPPH